jgi:hypothetical protein
MSAKDWGPGAWKFLHQITFYYPDDPTPKQQTQALNLFTSLRTLLPCEECRAHYDSDLNLHPPDTSSKTSLSQWLIDLHNRVNVRLGKPIKKDILTPKCENEQCASNSSKSYLWIIPVALIALLVLYLAKKR